MLELDIPIHCYASNRVLGGEKGMVPVATMIMFFAFLAYCNPLGYCHTS